ncbi:MAG: hypothetical protein ACYDB2_10680 [Acidimicrobiales bacterium]
MSEMVPMLHAAVARLTQRGTLDVAEWRRHSSASSFVGSAAPRSTFGPEGLLNPANVSNPNGDRRAVATNRRLKAGSPRRISRVRSNYAN